MTKTTNSNYGSIGSPGNTFDRRISADSDTFSRNDIDALGMAVDDHDHSSGKGLRVAINTASATLGADVALNNTSTYFDGPSMAQGTSGTWMCWGKIVITDTSANSNFEVKMWDGTTIFDSAVVTQPTANSYTVVNLAGILANPAGNIRISAVDLTTTNGHIRHNDSGLGYDCTIYGIRVA